MVVPQSQIGNIRYKYEVLQSCLDEKGRRLWAASEALSYGRGGISLVCKATGMSNATIHKGITEKKDSSAPVGRVRKMGGGRKKTTKTQRGLRKSLISLVEPTAKGDPVLPLKWTSKSTRNIADALEKQEYNVSHATVGTMLNKLDGPFQMNHLKLTQTQNLPLKQRIRKCLSHLCVFCVEKKCYSV